MKNKHYLFIIIILLAIAAIVFWLIPDRAVEIEIEEEEVAMEAEYLVRWRTNCEEEQEGVWLAEYEMCWTEESALRMKDSCEAMDGEWLKDTLLYECEIDGILYQRGEWEMIEWEMYEEMKQSCQEHDGIWLGGAEERCEIDGTVYNIGSWMALDEMIDSCLDEFGGEWLGGTELECEIDGVVYPGNWVQILAMKDSCENMDGTWLGTETNSCRLDGHVYDNANWERLAEFEADCLERGGEWLAGTDFECAVYDGVYQPYQWDRLEIAPTIGERCIEDGGSWNEDNRSCTGLPLEWCVDIEMEYDELRGLGWDESNLVCFIYL